MTERFAALTKIPKHPAARLLAMANQKLETKIDAPASAPVEVVLAELDKKAAWIDMLLLLAVAMPPRERVWWACLAARDLLAEGEAPAPPLATSEAWVFKPNDDNRAATYATIEHAPPKDDTVHCATAAVFADGTLGPGDLAEYPAPVGAAELSAFAMAVISLCHDVEQYDARAVVLVDRALDISRGGPGNIPMPPPLPPREETEDEEMEEEA